MYVVFHFQLEGFFSQVGFGACYIFTGKNIA